MFDSGQTTFGPGTAVHALRGSLMAVYPLFDVQ
jgi:hypothetical protein